jgi:ABC-2 type transport system ATP-binding protein
MNEHVIQTINLTKEYGELRAVDSVSLSIRKGEIFGLLGPNGAGKSTTIMMLTTLLKPSSGRAEICGYDVVKEPNKVRKSISVVFQDHTSDEWLTGWEYLRLHAGIYNSSEARIEELLILFNLKEWKDTPIKHYSSGMRRRLEIARGLVHHPEVLFLDEPTLGLDIQTRLKIWSYIESLSREEDVTIFLTTHYMEEADKLCDRIAIIDDGKIVAIGSSEELKSVLNSNLITVKVKNPEDMMQILSVLGMESEIQGNSIQVHTTNAGISEIYDVVRDMQNDVELFNVKKPTLDDVFIYYTGREIRDEASEHRRHPLMRRGFI